MREVLHDVERWRRDGKGVALATVVKVWGSAPRQPGAKMAVSSAGEVAGSVSGGCVEGAVVEAAQGVLASGTPSLLSFGVSDEKAWSVGLSCGGEIEVFVEPVRDEVFAEIARRLAAEEPVLTATVVAGGNVGARLVLTADGGTLGTLGAPELDREAERIGRGHLARLTCARETVETCAPGAETGARVFGEVFFDAQAPRPRLVAVGAGHVTIPLVAMAAAAGFETVVVDPRRAFATPERFAHADRLLAEWPDRALPAVGLHRATAVAVLSHDLKIDLPALRLALRSPAGYIGALGSKKTHAKRIAALREDGFGDAEIARIHAPIGLPLGGRRPEEIALAILAEIVATEHGVRLERKAPEDRAD
jgi:xanthine dehydrogenase accessory factor